MDTYSELISEAARLGEHNDCAVRAVTVVSGLPYAEVHAMFKQLGRKKGHGTYRNVTYKAISKLGFNTVDVTKSFKSRTICTLERELPCTGRYLVWTRGHMLGVKQGKVIDYTSGRRHRVLRVEKVIEKGQ